MPIIGIGFHLLVALYFGIHAIRSGQNLYWLIILFSFPLLGSIAYFFAIYLPASRLENGARKVAKQAVKILDPNRELRAAQAAFEYTPTAQNQMRLATAQLAAGQNGEAVSTYETCLNGPFANDLDIRLGAAEANFACAQYPKSIEHLQFIRQQQADFQAETVSLLLARAFAAQQQHAAAQAEFENAVQKFGSFDCKAEYLIWALEQNHPPLIQTLRAEVEHTQRHWKRHSKDLHRPVLARLKQAEQQTTNSRNH